MGLTNHSFQSLGEENVGKFTIAVLVNLKFGWQMAFVLPNLPKISLSEISHYTVLHWSILALIGAV